MKLVHNASTFSNQSTLNMTNPPVSNTPSNTAITAAKFCVVFATITATLVGNSLIYASVKRFRSLRTPTNIILVSLATTDLAMVLVMSLHAVLDLFGGWVLGHVWCDIVATFGLVLACVSILHLCFLSIDRYLAIKYPLRYPVLVTKKKVYVSLVFTWLVPSIFLNLPLADYNFRSEVYGCTTGDQTAATKLKPYIFIVVTIFFVIPFGVMLYTHAFVFRIALSHVKQLTTVERSLRSRDLEMQTNQGRAPQNVTSVSQKREIKSAKTFALVIGVFLFCYSPFFATGTYRRVAGTHAVPELVTFITTWLAFANSFSNPLVYTMRYSPFKKAFKKLCHCVKADHGVIGSLTKSSPARSRKEILTTGRDNNAVRSTAGFTTKISTNAL